MKKTSHTDRVVTVARHVALSLALGVSALSAGAIEVGGVNYHASTQAGSKSLQLNGAGVRIQANDNLYSVGLYLEKKTSTVPGVLANDGLKRLRVVMLRDISAKKLLDLLTSGLMANATDDDLEKLVPEISKVSVMISDQGKLMAGDTFQIDSDPIYGTTISLRGKGRGMPASQTFIRPELFNVMIEIWLGQRPVDAGLKNALLGQRT
jgi:hypothetical protein